MLGLVRGVLHVCLRRIWTYLVEGATSCRSRVKLWPLLGENSVINLRVSRSSSGDLRSIMDRWTSKNALDWDELDPHPGPFFCYSIMWAKISHLKVVGTKRGCLTLPLCTFCKILFAIGFVLVPGSSEHPLVFCPARWCSISIRTSLKLAKTWLVSSHFSLCCK